MKNPESGDVNAEGNPARPGSNPARPEVEGERKTVTVFFADVAGFTSMSEEMDPEEVSDLIQPCLEMMSEEIRRYGGTVAQFLGDGLMALFGAPVAYEDSPARAIHAALAIQDRLAEYSGRLTPGKLDVVMRIGINTGLVVVGSVGEEASMTYTAMGDAVNLASRMESTAEPGTVKVTQATYRLARDAFEFEDLGEERVKGKKKQIKVYRPLRPIATRPGVDSSVRAARSRFAGRSGELETLMDRFRQAAGGHGQVMALVGEPGIGKSRLVLELRESLRTEGCTYLEGGCRHYGEAISYLPILEVLKDYFDIASLRRASQARIQDPHCLRRASQARIIANENDTPAKEKFVEKLASLSLDAPTALSPLEDVLSLSVDNDAYLLLEPLQRRERIFEAVSALLLAESRKRTVVLVIEDMHWIDRTTEEFLGRFIDGIATAPVLLLLLYRPEYAPPWAGLTGLETMRLDRLPDESGSELVGSVFADAPVSKGLSDFIVGRTTGNPLFIEELSRALLESDRVAKDEGVFVLSGEPAETDIPDTVEGIIAARLDGLDREAKTTLQVASVIGREFDLRLLANVTTTKGNLEALLSRLEALEFVHETSRFPEPAYAFKHALTQEVAYNSLLLKKRREIHARVGNAVEGLYPDRLEEFYEVLANHYSRSGDSEKALLYLRLAGGKAARAYSNHEAVAFLKAALDLLETLPDTVENKKAKLEVSLALQEPLALLFYPEGSLEILEKAEVLANELGDSRGLTHTYRMLSRFIAIKGEAARAVEYSEKGLALAQETGDVETIAAVAFDVCNARYIAGDVTGISEIARKALGLIEEKHRQGDLYYVPDWTAYSALSGSLGLALGALGDFDEGEAALAKGTESSLAGGDSLGGAWIEYCHLTLSFSRGDAGGLIERSTRLISLFEDIGAEFVLGMCWSYLACGHYFSGDLSEARKCAEQGIESARKSGLPHNLPLGLVTLSLVQSGMGDFRMAEKTAAEALALSREHHSSQSEAYALFMLGSAATQARPGDTAEAEGHIRRGIDVVRGQDRKPATCHGLLFLGEVLALTGRTEEALESLEQAEAICVEMGMGYWLARAREALEGLAPPGPGGLL